MRWVGFFTRVHGGLGLARDQLRCAQFGGCAAYPDGNFPAVASHNFFERFVHRRSAAESALQLQCPPADKTAAIQHGLHRVGRAPHVPRALLLRNRAKAPVNHAGWLGLQAIC